MAEKQPSAWYFWAKDIVTIICLLGFLFFMLLGTRPLFVPDEGRYAEIVREMFISKHYITPYLDGIKYFEKPILFYWLGVLAVKIGGLTIWALRSVNAILAILGAIATYVAGRLLYGRTVGLLATLILGTSILYFLLAHMISLDMTVTVFLSICLYAFIIGVQYPMGATRRNWLWIAYAASALALLTKGLIGIAFPFLIIGSWVLLRNDWRLLKQIYLPSGLLLFFLIAAPWHILVSMHNPEFFYFYFIEQQFLRYSTMGIGHYQPAWFFIPFLCIGFFPWIVFLPNALYSAVRSSLKPEHGKNELFFLLWAVIIFAFFSFSKSKLIPYILPIFPPLALLTARYLKNTFMARQYVSIRISSIILAIASIAITLGMYWFLHHSVLADTSSAMLFLGLACAVLVIGVFFNCFCTFKRTRQIFSSLFVTTYLFLLCLIASIPSLDTRSIYPLAIPLKPLLQANDEVITYDQYYQDLPFYLDRQVSILNWHNELSFGAHHQINHAWLIDDKMFWQKWDSGQRVFVVLSLVNYDQLLINNPSRSIYLLAKTKTTALISNQKQ